MKLLMCPPDYYGVTYEINPWMNIRQSVDHPLAVKQWEKLYDTILSTGAKVDLITPILGWPDMVFTANAGLPHRHDLILSHFKYKERQGEAPYFYAWFKEAGYHILNALPHSSTTPFFEGAGDALFAGETLFAGYGFRTERAFYQQSGVFPSSLIHCELTDPYFYHLDTCFCPLTDTLAMWYPDAFTSQSQINIQQHIDVLSVEKEEAAGFACNAVVLDKHIILPTHSDRIARLLEQHGFTIHVCEMSEYLKAGGACKCLTLRLS